MYSIKRFSHCLIKQDVMKKIVLCMVIFVLIAFPLQSEGQDMDFSGKTVNVLFLATGVVQDFGNLTSDFEAKTGAKVNLVILGDKSFDEKADLELLNRKGAYDVIWVAWRVFHRWQQAGWLEPLDKYIADQNLADKEILKLEGFSSKAIEALTFDDKLYALPAMMGSMLLHYRKDVLDAHGLTKPPETWEELRDYAKKIHSEEIAGVGMRGSQVGGGVGFHAPMVLEAFGGGLVKDFPRDMHPDLDNPKSIEAAEFYADLLINYGFPGATTAHFLENVLAYQQGKVALLPLSNTVTGMILDPEKSTPEIIANTAFALIPEGPAGRVSASAVHGLGIPANSPQKELGYKFIEWALSEETQMTNCLKNNVAAITRPTLMVTDEYLEKFNWGDGLWARLVSETFDNYANPLFRPMGPEWREVEEKFAIAMGKLLTKQSGAKEALLQANKEIDQIYREAGHY
jgi:ABC-type glycerol-3-phosphate transport system substrate-binding protein